MSRRTHRPLIIGRRGAVATNAPSATLAGLDALRAGGTAADAAATVSLALGVAEPAMSGLGGDGFYHHFDAATGASLIYNGSGPAPRAATPERVAAGIPSFGPGSVSVPGALGALEALHRAHGRLPWADLVEPAIRLARDGFGATAHFCGFVRDAADRLAADPRAAALFLGRRPAELVVQPDLAGTLEEVAAEGAEGFYRGRLARRIARGLEEIGAPVTAADLAAFQPEPAPPVATHYRGLEVRQTPPNSTGFTMLQILRIAERFDLAALPPADRVHVLVEAKKLAFLDRDRHGTDPRFGDVPVGHLLSDGHADALARRISMRRAAHLPIGGGRGAGETTYFCVVDAAGNAASGIQSHASTFGSGLIAGDTGVLLNNRLAWWDGGPGHPNGLVAGKRVSHTMNAPVVLQDGALWALLGTPGADHQVQVNAQVFTAMADLGADPLAAIEAPRWSSSQPGQGAAWRGEGHGRLTVEEDFGAEVLADLAARGHDLHVVPHLGGPCAVNAIRITPEGVRVAGSDPRRDGWALAW